LTISNRRRQTIGRFPVLGLSEARTEAKKLLAEITLGKNKPKGISFEDAKNKLCDPCARARLSRILRIAPMIDHFTKTTKLMNLMKAALPFEVDVTPDLLASLATKPGLTPGVLRYPVTDIFYLGDDGGIMCGIALADASSVYVVSLTHLRVPRTLPFAAAAIDYQRHRVKKLKKQLRSSAH
jgi:hypothetical protein